jgi:predicted transcriptional regulator
MNIVERSVMSAEMLGSSRSRLAMMKKIVDDIESGRFENNSGSFLFDYVFELVDMDEARCRSTLDKLEAS